MTHPTDPIDGIRKALEAGPTDGPWSVLNHSWSDTSIIAPGFDHAICSLDINHATEESQEADEAQMATTAAYIAACNPAAIRALLERLDGTKALLSLVEEGKRNMELNFREEIAGIVARYEEVMSRLERAESALKRFAPVSGAVYEDGGVSLIRHGTEDARCANRGSLRLYVSIDQAMKGKV